MRIKNGKVFVGKTFVEADIAFDKTIAAVGRLDGEADFDARGCYVIPGMVDIHTHGAVGEDFSDGRPEGLQPMADYYCSRGVTSFLATTMTLRENVLTASMHSLRDFKRSGGAKCAGIHLEGPFLGYAKRGAQAGENLHRPDAAMFDRLNEASGGMVRLVTVACEEEGGMEFISAVSPRCAVSLGHTSCTYEQAMEAFDRGASHATHLFNAMDGLHHRKPGIIAAAADARASVEVICDGLHLHPAVIRLCHKLYGDRLNLISDSIRCAGMPDGEYELGGQPVTVRGGKATLTGTDTIAGSSISMLDALRNAAAFGLPLADVVYAASTAPADAVGLTGIGRLEPGCCADMVILDDQLNVASVFVDGELVFHS